MKGEEGVEERRGYFESYAICHLWLRGERERSKAKSLCRGRSAECRDVFYSEIKVGVFDLILKECPEALFQNTKGSLVPT